MFLPIAPLILLLFANVICVNGDNSSPINVEFLVFGPNELLVKINESPPPENFNFITLRIGVKRLNKNLEDLEYGENFYKNGNFYINDHRLQLKNGDIIHYLIAYRISEGYQAKSGKYVFDGVYRNRRIRRAISSLDIPSEHVSDDKSVNIRNRRHSVFGLYRDNSFDFRPAGPPYGRGPPFFAGPPFDPHNHQNHHHPHPYPHYNHGNGFGPPFGNHFCNSSEESDEEDDKSTSTSTPMPSPPPPPPPTTTTTTTTTTEFMPDIDIRFG